MSKRYEVFRKGFDGDARDIRRYDNAVDRLIEKLPTGDEYEWKRRGADVWRKAPSKPALREALLSRSLPVGDAFWARRAGGQTFVLRTIAVLTAPGYPDAGGTAGVKAAWDSSWEAFWEMGPGFEFVYMGAFVCRKIDGSSTWSQHAHHNAYDFRIRRASNPELSIDTEATTKVVNGTRSASEKIWQSAGHYFHAHITGDPKRFGTPACA
jgi:hypothetical protein